MTIPSTPTVPTIRPGVSGGDPPEPPDPPSIRAASSAGTLTNTLVIPTPDPTEDGDFLVAITASRGISNTFTQAVFGAANLLQPRGTAGNLQVFSKIAAAEPGQRTFTTAGASTHVGVMLAIRDHDGFDVAPIGATGAAATAHACPDLTPLTPGTRLIHGACSASGSDLTGDRYSWLIDEVIEALQNSGTGTGILSLATQLAAGTDLVPGPVATGISSIWAAFSLAIRPA